MKLSLIAASWLISLISSNSYGQEVANSLDLSQGDISQEQKTDEDDVKVDAFEHIGDKKPDSKVPSSNLNPAPASAPAVTPAAPVMQASEVKPAITSAPDAVPAAEAVAPKPSPATPVSTAPVAAPASKINAAPTPVQAPAAAATMTVTPVPPAAAQKPVAPAAKPLPKPAALVPVANKTQAPVATDTLKQTVRKAPTAQDIALTVAQSDSISAIRKASNPDYEKKLELELKQAKTEMNAMMVDATATLKVREKFDWVQKKTLELQKLKFERSLKIRDVLTVDQRKKLNEYKSSH